MSHRHRGDGVGMEQRCVEISSEVCLSPTVHGGDPDVTNGTDGSIAAGPTEHLAGFILGHDREGLDVRCEGGVTVCAAHMPDRARWEMTGSLEGGDLTLSPSILCRAPTLEWDEAEGHYRQVPGGECGFHGFVRGGTWVPA